MLCSYDDLCYIMSAVLHSRYCVIQHSCCNTNKTIIIIIIIIIIQNKRSCRGILFGWFDFRSVTRSASTYVFYESWTHDDFMWRSSNPHKFGRSIFYRRLSLFMEQSTISSSWFWTITLLEFRWLGCWDAFVWLKIAAPIMTACFESALQNVRTYLTKSV